MRFSEDLSTFFLALFVVLNIQNKTFCIINFFFSPASADCTHTGFNLEDQILKIRPKFSNYATKVEAADIEELDIDFTPAIYVFSGIGESFINLKSLRIISRSIEFVERPDLAALKQLEYLSLTGNEIEFLSDDVFSDLTNLKILDLDKNKIKKIPKNIFQNLKNIKTIRFKNNKIEYLPKDLFVNNLEIEKIYAGSNPLKTINVDFTALDNLNWLDLRNAKCSNFYAENSNDVKKAQRLINEDCRKST